MRAAVAGAVAALLLAGCTGAPGPSASASPATVCAGDQGAARYTLNLNATPPQQIDGAQVSVDGVGQDDQGPYAAIHVRYDDAEVTHTDLRVGSPVDIGPRTATVTHICVVTNLPTPLAPGTSRGSVGLS